MAYMDESPREKLAADIKHAGFYPELVLEVVDDALAGLEPDAHFVQHETHFSRNDLHRHITVMVLCGSQLVLAPLDDSHLEEDAQGTVAHVSGSRETQRPAGRNHQLRVRPAANLPARDEPHRSLIPGGMDRFAAY